MTERTKAIIKNAAVLSARALRRYRLSHKHEARAALQQALEATAEALEMIEHELKDKHP